MVAEAKFDLEAAGTSSWADIISFPACLRSTGPGPISDFQKSRLTTGANQHYSDLVPSLRGRAHVTDVGRDAVDAAVPLTNGADAYGQVVWF
jgi:hypothetical protein